jgi:signal transduction histidine kinase
MFVYSVSHDLRSPLVNLQGFSKELEKGGVQLAAVLDDAPADVGDRGRTLLDGKMARSIGFIQSAVLRLSGIIDALLRLSRAGRVEYRREAVDTSGIVAQVVGAAQGTIAERGAVVRVGELPGVWGDRTAVEQVFGNLIGNALTYLDPARPGVIEVGCLPPGAPGVPNGYRAYFVRDNGLGIAEGHRSKIFQAFQRAHPGIGSGEGLGLAIVARVAERHRGRVWVESEPGAGSTFFVTLPTDGR